MLKKISRTFAITILGIVLLYLVICGCILNITIIKSINEDFEFKKRKESLLKIDSLYKANPSVNVDSLKDTFNLPF